MKGPDRPHTMQTNTPSPARPAEGVATTAPLSTASGAHDSQKVDTSTQPCEDWSVTIRPAAIRWRYSAWWAA